MNFNLFKSGEESFKLRFYVGHDGSMVRLASGFGFGKIAPLRWPALGSEIVMEVSINNQIPFKYLVNGHCCFRSGKRLLANITSELSTRGRPYKDLNG